MSEHETGTVPQLLTTKDILKVVPLSRGTIWSLRKMGKFPQPIYLSERRVAWRSEDVQAWIASGGVSAAAQ